MAQLVKNVRDLGLIPELGISAGERKGYPLQYSGLENSMDYMVHGISKSRTRLSDFHFRFQGSNQAYCLGNTDHGIPEWLGEDSTLGRC